MADFPTYLNVPADQLGAGTPVQVTVVGDAASVAESIVETTLEEIQRARDDGREATLIVPVGPVDQYPLLAERVNRERISLADVMLINMDEYLTDKDEWIPREHPLSFRGFMDRLFYDRLDPELAPREENRVFPDPKDPDEIGRLIDRRGGVDATFGGIGINGHIAFNEPPEPGEPLDDALFAILPTRLLNVSRETRTINSVTVGGEISIVPKRCITVGMREILSSKRLHFYCNRPWQRGVVRRVLHGPVTAACPASFLRNHPAATLTVADFVAEPPEIQLR